MLLSLSLSTFYLLVTHTRWKQEGEKREREREREKRDSRNAVRHRGKRDISMKKKRAIETGNGEAKEEE